MPKLTKNFLKYRDYMEKESMVIDNNGCIEMIITRDAWAMAKFWWSFSDMVEGIPKNRLHIPITGAAICGGHLATPKSNRSLPNQ